MVRLERRPGDVAVVVLDRPKMNALSVKLLSELGEVIGELAADLPGAVVVTGGDRIFAAGADVSEFGGPAAAATVGAAFRATLGALAELPRVTIAAISGYALGGGCELALCCDIRIAGRRAQLGQPEILLGILPGGGGTQRLPRLIGVGRAKELILSGRMVGADEAMRIGLVDEVVDDADVLDVAVGRAERFAAGPRVAQGLAKACIDRGLECSLDDGLELEARAFTEVFSTEDAAIGVASFLRDGPGRARFVGR
jgi:enoyl-CoA hydratase/carnithine racemase